MLNFLIKKDAYEFEQNLIRENWGNPLLLNQRITLKNTDGSLWVEQKRKPCTPETRLKLSQASLRSGNKPPNRKGIKNTPEHCKNISIATTGVSKNVGKNNIRYGKGHEIMGANNPNSASWQVRNNVTGETIIVDDLPAFGKSINENRMYKYKDAPPTKPWTIVKLTNGNNKC